MIDYILISEQEKTPAYWYNEEVFDNVRELGQKAGGENYDFDSFAAFWEVAKMVTERDVKIKNLKDVLEKIKNQENGEGNATSMLASWAIESFS